MPIRKAPADLDLSPLQNALDAMTRRDELRAERRHREEWLSTYCWRSRVFNESFRIDRFGLGDPRKFSVLEIVILKKKHRFMMKELMPRVYSNPMLEEFPRVREFLSEMTEERAKNALKELSLTYRKEALVFKKQCQAEAEKFECICDDYQSRNPYCDHCIELVKYDKKFSRNPEWDTGLVFGWPSIPYDSDDDRGNRLEILSDFIHIYIETITDRCAILDNKFRQAYHNEKAPTQEEREKHAFSSFSEMFVYQMCDAFALFAPPELLSLRAEL